MHRAVATAEERIRILRNYKAAVRQHDRDFKKGVRDPGIQHPELLDAYTEESVLRWDDFVVLRETRYMEELGSRTGTEGVAKKRKGVQGKEEAERSWVEDGARLS